MVWMMQRIWKRVTGKWMVEYEGFVAVLVSELDFLLPGVMMMMMMGRAVVIVMMEEVCVSMVQLEVKVC